MKPYLQLLLLLLAMRMLHRFFNKLPGGTSSSILEALPPRFGLVLGNEAGDLDSAVSSIVYAQHLTDRAAAAADAADCDDDDAPLYLPVMAFERQDLPLKTEVVWCLDQFKLDINRLPCADDVDWGKHLDRVMDVVLVDHNVINNAALSVLDDKVSAILDHHVRERKGLDKMENATVETVGSCTTLVAERILREDPEFDDEVSLRLLRGTILTDTANLSPKVKKATPKDVAVLQQIEARLGLDDVGVINSTRKDLFEQIKKARNDIGHFTTLQLLRKDLKVITFNHTGNASSSSSSAAPSPPRPRHTCPPPAPIGPLTVSMSTVPKLTSRDLLNRSDFTESFNRFRDDNGHELVVVLATGDLLIFADAKDNRLARVVKEGLLARNPDIRMQEEESGHEQAVYMTRKNFTYSRKKLLPLIRQAVEEAL